MESDEGKLFIGGIAWDTTEETLRDYFGQFGEVSQTVIMRDKTTDRPRGFGFVVFSDPSVLDSVLHNKHTIDGRTVEAKRALSREEQHNNSRYGNSNVSRGSSEAGKQRTKKIFVGGLPPTLSEDGFREYFEGYGAVTDVVIMYDQSAQRPRGFGFISFDTEDAVDRVLQKTFHELNGKLVEVKRALPKDANPGGGGGGRGGGYQSYGSGSNASSVDGGMDGNRFMQQQGTGGGYPPYSSFGAPNYGYGAANAGVGYGAYGGYGVGGYGAANTGFNGPAGAYGTPNIGYAGGQPAALKSQWSGQTHGYGGSGYSANTGYGATASWGASGGGGSVSAPMGQAPSGASGYGGQGYGYGNYSGSEGFYSNSGGGAGAGDQQGTGGGYGASGYGNNNGTSGY